MCPRAALCSRHGLPPLQVGNAHELLPTAEYVARMTGFHEFAEFVAEASAQRPS